MRALLEHWESASLYIPRFSTWDIPVFATPPPPAPSGQMQGSSISTPTSCFVSFHSRIPLDACMKQHICLLALVWIPPPRQQRAAGSWQAVASAVVVLVWYTKWRCRARVEREADKYTQLMSLEPAGTSSGCQLLFQHLVTSSPSLLSIH